MKRANIFYTNCTSQRKENLLVSIYAWLDNESKSTQIRKDFIRKLKLKGKTKFVSISNIKRKTNINSIKDSRETIITTEAELQVVDNSNTLRFSRKDQNQIPSQHPPPSYKSSKEWVIYRGDSCLTLTQPKLH